ncbi:agmatinase [Desulfonatronovibrio magnus]|uniref:agmatinase n=1 Tax=Desulfonatronovibrio magnus TaxID=698827 RepID=UPI0005EB4C96|nr:agmatinase [Desulfonatronovibrio magnus]
MYNNFLDLDPRDCGPNIINVWPVPYQGTVSYSHGTGLAPEAILKASYHIETYDPELDVDISRYCTFNTLPFQRVNVSGPEAVCSEMTSLLQNYCAQDFFLTLGGEHSISSPIIKFYAQQYPNLAVIQIDAHADLKDEYEGSNYSHACVMARCHEHDLRLVQIGIRSLDAQEMRLIQNNPKSMLPFFPWDLPDPEQAARQIRNFIENRPVYITFDADGLDPSIMPGTGTPEPGGLDYKWIQDLWKHLWPGPKLVGMDYCEVAPVAGSVVSESVAVKCILRILSAYFSNK